MSVTTVLNQPVAVLWDAFPYFLPAELLKALPQQNIIQNKIFCSCIDGGYTVLFSNPFGKNVRREID